MRMRPSRGSRGARASRGVGVHIAAVGGGDDEEDGGTLLESVTCLVTAHGAVGVEAMAAPCHDFAEFRVRPHPPRHGGEEMTYETTYSRVQRRIWDLRV